MKSYVASDVLVFIGGQVRFHFEKYLKAGMSAKLRLKQLILCIHFY